MRRLVSVNVAALCASLLCVILSNSPTALAQTVPQLGIAPFSSVTGGPDQINLSNLAVHYSVPVFSRPGHGLPFSFALSFDNVNWSAGFPPGQSYLEWMPFFPFSGGGFGAAGAVFYSKADQTCTDSGGNTQNYTQWTFTSFLDASGTTHPFNVIVNNDTDDTGTCTSHYGKTSATGGSSDGSRISMSVTDAPSAVVTFPSGLVVNAPLVTATNGIWGATAGPYTVTDSNGNQISVAAPGGVLSSITDTLGTVALTSSGTYPSPISYTYTAPSGAAASVTRSFVAYTVQTAFGCPNVADYPATSFQLLDRITLPDGSYYGFTYEKTSSGSLHVTGRIASVHLPTGGTISYTYTGGYNNTGVFCADASTAGLNRQTPDGTWKYVRTLTLDSFGQPSTSTNTITDPLGNQTVVNFGGNYETQRQIYTGTAGGTPLETVTTCYNGNTTNCAAATATSITTPTEITVFRSMNGGPQSEVDTFYNGPLVTQKNEYDFGASSPTRKTAISYATLGNGILDRPSMVTVTDGSGNLQSQTAYFYDEDEGALQSSGASHLVSVTCTPTTDTCRGNVTTVKSYVTGSTYLTKSFTHYDTGQMYQATDANGAVTTNTYGGCGNSLLTNVAMPLSLSASYQWNCTGGVMKQATDANGQSTYSNYTTDTHFWRPESTKDQNLNVTSLTYTGLTRVESVLPVIANISNVDVVKSLDTLGRPTLTQTRQAPGSTNFDSVVEWYDSDGRLAHTSMPYVGTLGQNCCGAPATTTTYDGMGRVIGFQDGSNTTVGTAAYTQNDIYTNVVAPLGENNKRKQSQYDGLGRLTSVCEVSSNVNDPYLGTCLQTVQQAGYWTKYLYNQSPYFNSLTVQQSAQTSPTQTRTYVYDDLGRLTIETNPETGTTQYFYDTAPATPGASCPSPSTSNGDLVKKYDAQGNTICYQYDALHRLTAVLYPAGPDSSRSVQKHFVYDSALISTYSLSNTLGRLSEAYTGPSTGKITDLGFSYSARGEVTDVYENTPHSGGFYHVSGSYFPHGLLNSLNLNLGTGMPTIYFGGSSCSSCLDGEGRVLQVTASSGQNPVGLNGATGVTYATSGTTQPIGSLTKVTYGSGDFDSFSYDTNTGRMTQYLFSVGGTPQTDIGTLTWNPNGSLKTLAIADQLNPAENQTCNYAYDDFGRSSAANCGSVWNQAFSYDPFGNITKSGSSAFAPTYNVSNQYLSVGTCGAAYNLNGDPMNDCEHQYTWNADNRPTTIDTSNSYTYDALGRLVELVYTSGNTEFLYSPTGQELALMNGQTLQKAMIHLPGGGTAIYKNGTSPLSHYRHGDWLGSARLSTTPTQTCYYDVAYAPFGETYAPLVCSGGNTSVAFAGQGKDTTTDLYPFLFREYNSIQSRWVWPDPSGLGAVSMGNPQTWNRYGYVANTPLNAVDPSGLQSIDDAIVHADGGCVGGCIDPGAAFIQDAIQSFYVQAGLNSPTQQALQRYQQQVDAGFNALQPGAASPEGGGSEPGDPRGYTIIVHCGGSLGNVICLPPEQAAAGSQAFSSAKSGPSSVEAFAKSLFSWKNFSAGFTEGGCFRQFAEEAFDPAADVAGQDAAIKATAKSGAYAAATAYAAHQSLVVPMRSSIVRGILDVGEVAGEAIALGATIYDEGKALVNEVKSFQTGECQ